MPFYLLSSLFNYIWPTIFRQSEPPTIHVNDDDFKIPSDDSLKLPEPTIESIVKRFLNTVGYEERPQTLDAKLLAAVIEKSELAGIRCDEDPSTIKFIKVGLAMAQLSYPYHSFELMVHVTMFTWLATSIDDLTSRYDSDIREFPKRFYEGSAQKSPLLQAFADNLRGMFKFYDPIIASSIVLSGLAFVDGCLMEIRPEYQNMPQTNGGERWAQYFRIRNGIADAYAYFTFPQTLCPDVSSFLQVTPDFGEFICVENDLLSFYKEEIAGETRNYVHIRAKYENKKAIEMLEQLADDAVAMWARIGKVLKDQGNCEKAFHAYVQGFSTFHKCLPRYRLEEIGLGENLPFA